MPPASFDDVYELHTALMIVDRAHLVSDTVVRPALTLVASVGISRPTVGTVCDEDAVPLVTYDGLRWPSHIAAMVAGYSLRRSLTQLRDRHAEDAEWALLLALCTDVDVALSQAAWSEIFTMGARRYGRTSVTDHRARVGRDRDAARTGARS
jgi:hypothetical protein